MSKENPTAEQVRDAIASMLERVETTIGIDEDGNGMSGAEGDADFWWSEMQRLGHCQLRILTEYGDVFIVNITRGKDPNREKSRK